MKKLVSLAIILLTIIGGIYVYATSSSIEVIESTKYRIEYDTKTLNIKNTSNKRQLVQLEVIEEVKTSFGNYQPFSIKYEEVILDPKEEKSIDIIQYHTRKLRYKIVKEVELKGGE